MNFLGLSKKKFTPENILNNEKIKGLEIKINESISNLKNESINAETTIIENNKYILDQKTSKNFLEKIVELFDNYNSVSSCDLYTSNKNINTCHQNKINYYNMLMNCFNANILYIRGPQNDIKLIQLYRPTALFSAKAKGTNYRGSSNYKHKMNWEMDVFKHKIEGKINKHTLKLAQSGGKKNIKKNTIKKPTKKPVKK